MKEIIARIKGETPKFFKRLQILGGSLATLGLALTQIPNVPASIYNIAGHLVIAGPVIIAVCQFACTNAPGSETSK